MSSDLAVVICHGNYLTPAPYQPLINALKARGIEAHCPQLATSDLSKLNVGDVSSPNFDLGPPPGGLPQGEADTAIIHSILRRLIEEQSKKVLLLAHSAGGWVATQSAIPELQAKARKEKGLSGGVVGLFYFGAFIIPVGDSIHSTFQPKEGPAVVPPWLEFHKYGVEGVGTLVEPEKYLYHDLPASEAEKWSKQLTASPIGLTVLTYDAYAALPCAYLVLEEDRLLPKEYQEGMVQAQSQKTGDFKVFRSQGGHAAFLSRTEELAGFVKEFADGLIL